MRPLLEFKFQNDKFIKKINKSISNSRLGLLSKQRIKVLKKKGLTKKNKQRTEQSSKWGMVGQNALRSLKNMRREEELITKLIFYK